MPFVTDLQGRVVWYFDVQHSGLGISSFGTQTFEPGGTVLGFGQDRYSVRNNQDVLREIDLAGNPVRETNLAALNAQLTALGYEVSYGFHHDAQRLPNGDTLVFGLTERKIDLRGTPTNYIGDLIAVLMLVIPRPDCWASKYHSTRPERSAAIGFGTRLPVTPGPTSEWKTMSWFVSLPGPGGWLAVKLGKAKVEGRAPVVKSRGAEPVPSLNTCRI